MAESRRKKILIVDDESPIAELIAEFCQMLGYETKILMSGEGVLAAVKSYMPTLVTLDLLMPNVTGFEVLKSLKEDSETKSIPVIVISAVVSEISGSEITELSQAILSKPVRLKKLKGTIEKVLSDPLSSA